jgi:hypothetical protein
MEGSRLFVGVKTKKRINIRGQRAEAGHRKPCLVMVISIINRYLESDLRANVCR